MTIEKPEVPDAPVRKTLYLILYSQTGRTWEISGELEATGADAAIRQYTTGMTETDGLWVAVPERSFQPKKIKPKVVTTHTLEAAPRPGIRLNPTSEPQPTAA